MRCGGGVSGSTRSEARSRCLIRRVIRFAHFDKSSSCINWSLDVPLWGRLIRGHHQTPLCPPFIANHLLPREEVRTVVVLLTVSHCNQLDNRTSWIVERDNSSHEEERRSTCCDGALRDSGE